MRIAVDAMGGDYAPHNVIAGVADALRESGDRFEIILVGRESAIREELARAKPAGSSPSVVAADDVVGMDDAAAAVKQKPRSSIAVGIGLHRDGKADAFVSAGHSGAVMFASTVMLGRIEGISRPTIGAFFPSEEGACLLLDAGANVDCRPKHLVEFALMGSIYAERILRISRPVVGLLNIGEEDSKGNEVAREAHLLLQKSGLNFVGNVEGRDILSGRARVIVCDGFIGNILLKFGESVPGYFRSRMKQVTGTNFLARLAAGIARGTMRKALKSMDYEEHGGVPILGIKGVAIIGHGKSTPKAIKNMIFKAEEMIKSNINDHIRQALAATI